MYFQGPVPCNGDTPRGQSYLLRSIVGCHTQACFARKAKGPGNLATMKINFIIFIHKLTLLVPYYLFPTKSKRKGETRANFDPLPLFQHGWTSFCFVFRWNCILFSAYLRLYSNLSFRRQNLSTLNHFSGFTPPQSPRECSGWCEKKVKNLHISRNLGRKTKRNGFVFLLDDHIYIFCCFFLFSLYYFSY